MALVRAERQAEYARRELERLQAERKEAPRSKRKLTLPQSALAGGGPSDVRELTITLARAMLDAVRHQKMPPDNTMATTQMIIINRLQAGKIVYQ